MSPHSSVQSVILYNSKDSDGNDIPTKIEVNSWVTLMPEKRGGHGKDAKKHGSTSAVGAYKAKIVQFRMTGGALSGVRVQHAYMFRQLDLDPALPLLGAQCNYLYLSNYFDWINPKSILGIIIVMHAEIGEFTRGNRSHKELLESSIFFCNACYIPRASQQSFGQIIPIPLSDFSSPEWPLLDMSTTESFRAKFRLDFHNAMRPTTGSRHTHLSWFLPFCVFIDLFYCAANMYKTTMMYVIKMQASDDLYSSIMDKGWDEKVTIGEDIVKTVVQRDSLRFRYHIGRSTLYANFVYNRFKRCASNISWEAIDQYEAVEMVTIFYELEGRRFNLEVGVIWTFFDIRQEINFQTELPLDREYAFWIVNGEGKASKVNTRNEKKTDGWKCFATKFFTFRV